MEWSITSVVLDDTEENIKAVGFAVDVVQSDGVVRGVTGGCPLNTVVPLATATSESLLEELFLTLGPTKAEHENTVLSGGEPDYTYPWPYQPKEVLDAEQERRNRNDILELTVDPIICNPLRWDAMTEAKQNEWLEYRQALLDITLQEGFPYSIVWPTKPEQGNSMSTFYFGSIVNHPLLLNYIPPQPLLQSLKEDLTGPEKEILHCPSHAKMCKDVYVIRSPMDVKAIRDSNGKPRLFFGPQGLTVDVQTSPDKENASIVQMFNEGLYLGIADSDDCEIEITPPYMHNSPLRGIAGAYNAGSWFRPLSIASFISDNFELKRGDAIAYLKVPAGTTIEQVIWPESTADFFLSNVNDKNMNPKVSLKGLYKKFKMSGMKSSIIKLAKENVVRS